MGATVLDIHSGFMNCYEHANTHLEIIAQLSVGFQIDGAAEALRQLYMRLVFFQLCCFGFFSLFLYVAPSFSLRRSRSFDLPQSLFSSLALSLSGFFSSISCRYLARVARIMKWAKNTNIHNENKLIASEERKKSATHKTAFETVLEICLPVASCAYVSVTRAPFEYWWLM